jgi:hypothetical protein
MRGGHVGTLVGQLSSGVPLYNTGCPLQHCENIDFIILTDDEELPASFALERHLQELVSSSSAKSSVQGLRFTLKFCAGQGNNDGALS